MSDILKPGNSRGGIISNLDRKLTKAQLAEKDAQEKRIEFITRKYADAEKDVLNNTEQPDVIYTGIQRDDVYSADPNFDKSRAAVVDMQSLPVKQYGISPEGDFEVYLDPDSAALELVKQRVFCVECGDRQPEMPELWQHAADRLIAVIGRPPTDDFRHGERCCYCGHKLGIGGDALEKSGFEVVTPDQARILGEIFGEVEGVTDTDFAKS